MPRPRLVIGHVSLLVPASEVEWLAASPVRQPLGDGKMEKHSLHGRVETKFEGAPKSLIERLAKHDTAKICDSMGGHGAMQFDIKPLENKMRVIGSALTVLTRPGDALYVQH